jgi:hypothetical protein
VIVEDLSTYFKQVYESSKVRTKFDRNISAERGSRRRCINPSLLLFSSFNRDDSIVFLLN